MPKQENETTERSQVSSRNRLKSFYAVRAKPCEGQEGKARYQEVTIVTPIHVVTMVFFAWSYADRGSIAFVANLAVNCGDVEVQFPRKLGFEFYDLQIDYHIAVQSQVIEQQIDAVLVAVDLDLILSPDISKACSEFQQELGDVLDETVFQFAFVVSLR